MNGKANRKFGVPMMWREPKNHHDDCYFCMVNTKGLNGTSRHTVAYPDLESARRPVEHCPAIPIPSFTSLPDLEDDDSCTYLDEVDDMMHDVDFKPGSSIEPDLFEQGDLNDLVRDLNLSKQQSEVLASRLQERALLHPSTNVTFYRNREQKFLPYLTSENSFVYCNDIGGLLLAMGVPNYKPSDWRLFIDSSKRSLKCVLLHNDAKHTYGAVPIGHSTKLKEDYESINKLFWK
jgi:hypothetical protein